MPLTETEKTLPSAPPLTSATADIELATPMLRQFLEIKRQHPGVLLLYQMGEFYETFFEDALIAARALEITLTAREGGKLGKVPMAGIPIHKADVYLGRLLAKNFRVAICQQVEDPAQAKGLVERKVTRVLSPGTVTDDSLLTACEQTYLAAVMPPNKKQPTVWGLAYCDLSTETFCATQLNEDQLLSELQRLNPREVLGPRRKERRHVLEGVDEWVVALPDAIANNYSCTPLLPEAMDTMGSDAALCRVFNTTATEGLGLDNWPQAKLAAGAMSHTLLGQFPQSAPTFEQLHTYTLDDAVLLNVAARRNLELLATVRTGQYQGSLCSVLDATHTSMGGRLLRTWISQPLKNRLEIQRRLDAVDELTQHPSVRSTLGQCLPRVYDMERLAVRLRNGQVAPRDLLALKNSIQQLPAMSNALKPLGASYLSCLHTLPQQVFALLTDIEAAIDDAAPITLQEGGIFKPGYHAQLDEFRSLVADQQQWLSDYQDSERERTGIKTLKVSHNNAFGFFIEISRGQAANAPDDYTRKQTLTNVERFTTELLKEREQRVLSVTDEQLTLEYNLFIELRHRLTAFAPDMLTLARQVARLDVLASFASVAVERHYTKPQLDDSLEVQIQDGRHPVVETVVPMGTYVANHCHLSANPNHHPLVPQFQLITGPNMAGKSTYMRQVALIVLMAQMGSFVPAEYARIGMVDAVFTRIGAMDDLSSGQSTFMVEMQETAQIMHGATQRSLVLLDEVGRGTSTSDGIAIAQSVTEFMVNHLGARTLFATHYHELNALESKFPGIQNVRVGIAETETATGLEVAFLHKVEPGTAQKSYGVHVAKMAGLPPKVVQRANALLNRLGQATASLRTAKPGTDTTPTDVPQLNLF